KNSARGRLRFGLTTSEPANVTLFQASEEKSGPTSATQTIVTVARLQGTPCQEYLTSGVDTACAECGLVTHQMPSAMIPSSAPTLSTVNMFCTQAPVRTPKALTPARNSSARIAMS